MNQPSHLNFNKSSLVGLQAELARKKEEAERSQKTDQKKPTKLEIKPHIRVQLTRKPKVTPKNDQFQDCTPEDTSLLNQARESLIAKSKLYDKLRNKKLHPEESDQYLVDFSSDIDSAAVNQAEDSDSDPDSEWVTFTDSLGRSRTCLRSDLSYYKELDTELKVGPPAEETSTKEDTEVNESARIIPEEVQLWDQKREELRKMWEEEEKRLSEKKDIHYQDVLFDEARVHGVGYFRFSQDETERQKQHEELQKLRQETEKNQMATMTVKERREQQMKRRIEAAKKRKRERLGLPPQEEIEEPNPLFADEAAEINTKPQESENLEKKVEELLKNVERSRHVRPWDVGKDGVKPRVLTQDEWNEKQRAIRVQEFAPPTVYKASAPEDTGGLYFTTKKFKHEKPKENKTVPIRFEYDIDEARSVPQPSVGRKGAAVPPPVSYNDSTPTRKPKNSSVNDAIEAGLNYLKHEAEMKNGRRDRGLLDII